MDSYFSNLIDEYHRRMDAVTMPLNLKYDLMQKYHRHLAELQDKMIQDACKFHDAALDFAESFGPCDEETAEKITDLTQNSP